MSAPKLPDDWSGMFVGRDGQGKIRSAAAHFTEGEAEEPLASNNPELLAFMEATDPNNAASVAERAAARTRIAAFEALPERADMLDKLRNATPAQIDTWLTNNVTNLAQARTVLGQLMKVLATRL